MKKIMLFLLIFVFIPCLTFPKNLIQVKANQGDLQQNNILMNNYWNFWVNYEGMLGKSPFKNFYGGEFTNKRVPILYSEGLLWGGIIRKNTGESKIDTPRVGGIHYKIGTQAGHVINLGEYYEIDENSIGVFKINKSWQVLKEEELKEQLKVLFNLTDGDITNEMVEQLKQKYAKDWKNWPVNLGAPFVDLNHNGIYDPILDANGYPLVDSGDYPGVPQAEQTIFLVINDLDSIKVKKLSGCDPLGLEIQITIWSYNTDFLPLAHTLFKRYVIVNKSNHQIDSLFIGQYVDPDIGDYSDDFIGCDTLLNLAYAYNSGEVDNKAIAKDLPPPAVGYCLLQGPVVKTENSHDVAYQNFKPIFSHKNLPMTSFVYWAAGGSLNDPPLGIIDYALQMYNMLNGYIPTNDLEFPTPYIIGSGPNAGQPTKFPLSGDPVNDPNGIAGDVDGQGWNMGPSDRKFILNSGPFVLKPNESQEILMAIIGGQEKDRLQAIVQLKKIAQYLRIVYQNQFEDIYPVPDIPQVKATPFDDYVVLNWGWDEESVKNIEQQIKNGFQFEGYNIYQLPDSSSTINDPQAVKIATFDRINGVTQIVGLSPSPQNGRYYETVLQLGEDSGIEHYLIIKNDYINQKPLYRGSTYYFAVTAYNYNPQLPQYPSLESAYKVVPVTIQDEKPGDRYLSEADQTVEVTASKESDIFCSVRVVDPTEVTGHNYQVYFSQDLDSTSKTYGQWLWNLKDVTLNKVVLMNQTIKKVNRNIPSEKVEDDFLIVDGLLVKVWRIGLTVKAIVQVADAEGPLSEDEFDWTGEPYGGNNVWHSLSSPHDANKFYLSAGGGTGSMERILQSIANTQNHDFELRFTNEGGYYVWWDDDSNKVATKVPFEAWDVGEGTYDDPTDDVRCLTGGYSGGKTVGVFDFVYQDPYFGFPATDWIDIRKPLNEQGTYQVFKQDIESGAFSYNWWENSVEVLSNIIICDFGGARTLPQDGTIIRFITAKLPDEDLIFSFKAPDKIENDLELMKKDVEKINVFPNPYYAACRLEPDRFTHFVTFNHLPPHAIIRIFTLNGVLVRKLEKRDNSQFFRWDLKNEKNRAVASGMYIIQVDMPELNKQKILKLLVISNEQIK